MTLTHDTPVQFLRGVGPRRAEAFARIGVRTVEDLLYHTPHRYVDATSVTPIAKLVVGQEVTVVGRVVSTGVLPTRRRLRIFRAILKDASGVVECAWQIFQRCGMALRRLRRLGKDEHLEELDLDATIDTSARNAEIDLVFGPPRKNRIKLLLLVDVGGSMDPHADLSERLFSAAHAANHFHSFESRFFHNCVYETLFTDIYHFRGGPTEEVLKKLDRTWSVILVGDAWMSPFELTHRGGAIDLYHDNRETGLAWLKRIRERCPQSVWLNPEPRRVWRAPSIRLVREVFPMYELTLDGLDEAVDVLCGRRAPRTLSMTTTSAAGGVELVN